jgi:long-chain fatty acid transport protein
MQYSKGTLLMAVSALALLTAQSAQAGGFALKERSAKAQGLSFAGATAGSGGISSMGFNPAAIGLVESGELAGGLSFIQPIADGDVRVNGVSTGETVDADQFAGLANGYAAYRLEPDILIGVSLFTPFGLTTSYEANSTVANDAITSQLLTFQLSPVVAYEPFPGLTFALQGNIFYADARLTSANTILEGDQTTLGFGAGVLWKPTDSTSIGFAYDHGYNLSLEGDATFAPGIAAPAAFGAITQPATATTELPSTVSVGVIQGLTENLRVMGEFQWQDWDSFDRIDIAVNGNFSSSDEQNYEDAFFIAAGAEYDITSNFTLRAGAAWDQTPTSGGFLEGQINSVNATDRTPRVPDEDRIWLSIGASFDVDEHMTVDAGYSYLFTINDPVVGLRNAAPGTQVVYDGGAHIFSVGGSLKF